MLKFRDMQFKIIDNKSSHRFAMGTIVKPYVDSPSTTAQWFVPVEGGIYDDVSNADLEYIEPENAIEIEDPQTIRVRTLRAQAEILTKIDCKGFDQSKVDKLTKFYLECIKAKLDRRIAMRAVEAQSKVG